jgi:hypothetical protein
MLAMVESKNNKGLQTLETGQKKEAKVSKNLNPLFFQEKRCDLSQKL